MKNGMRKVIVMAVVALLTVSLCSGALAAPLFISEVFRLPAIKHRVVETPAPTAEPTETPAPQDDIPASESVAAYVKDGELNVYAHNRADAEMIAKLTAGDSVTILGRSGDWARVRTADGKDGYVTLQSLTTEAPVAEPTEEPVVEPTEEPAVDPTVDPTEEPVVEPTEEPAVDPTEEPVVEPTEEPAVEPTEEPAVEPTEEPAVEPTEEPVVESTEEPVVEPTEEPVVEPTEEPAVEPTEEPAAEPTEEPIVEPTEEPAVEPTEEPIVEPTEEPVVEPTEEPAVEPTEEPAVEPTMEPVEDVPAEQPEHTAESVVEPTVAPTVRPIRDLVVPKPDATVVGDADVRVSNDGLSEIFITLPEGTPLNVVAVTGDWVQVEVDGQIGYIYKDSVAGIEFEEPEQPEGEKPQPKVTIFSSRRSVMAPGEMIVLTSKLEGFEGYETSFQWECDKGAGFEAVPGANEDTYSFEASIESLSYDWRLAVYYR